MANEVYSRNRETALKNAMSRQATFVIEKPLNADVWYSLLKIETDEYYKIYITINTEQVVLEVLNKKIISGIGWNDKTVKVSINKVSINDDYINDEYFLVISVVETTLTLNSINIDGFGSFSISIAEKNAPEKELQITTYLTFFNDITLNTTRLSTGSVDAEKIETNTIRADVLKVGNWKFEKLPGNNDFVGLVSVEEV